MIPILSAEDLEKEKQKKEDRIKSITALPGTRPPKIETPIIPIGDDCCPKVCKALNNQIDHQQNFLNMLMEQYEDPETKSRSHAHTGTSYTVENLKQFRRQLKNDNICECVK